MKIQNHNQAIQEIENIMRDFPRFESIELHRLEDLARSEIFIRKCKMNRTQNTTGAEKPDLLFESTIDAIKNRNSVALGNLLSCSFILMDSGCAGDPLSWPPGDKTANQILEMTANTTWQKTVRNCFAISDKEHVCFTPVQEEGKYYWNFICREEI